MRLISILVATGAVLVPALVGLTGVANASATIDLIWAETGTDEISRVDVTSNITLRVILTAGPNGVLAAAISVDYSEVRGKLAVIGYMSTPGGPLPLDFDNFPINTGSRIETINSVAVPPSSGIGLLAGQSHQLGTVTFHKSQLFDGILEIRSDANATTDGAHDLASNDITPTMTFNSAFVAQLVDVPTGAVVSWGDNSDGEASPPFAVNGVSGTATDIAAGANHSCAIQVGTGNVVCWGSDFFSDGTTYFGQATPPNDVNGVSGTATDIATSSYHSCAIQAGTADVVCWGWDNYGQATPPAAVNGTSGTASDIAAGRQYNCAIQAGTGDVVCWGRDSFGQVTPPDDVNGVSGTATEIAAGGYHSCAIQAGTSHVICWGRDTFGQAMPPDDVNGVSGTATDIALGRHHSCAIQAGTGNVICWGSDFFNDGTTYFGQATPPDTVNGVSGTATDIAASSYHSCAIQAGTGDVVCWGRDSLGQATPPDDVNGVSGTATDIAAGYQHSLAIVPEPSALTSLGSGIVMLKVLHRRRRNSNV